MTRNQATQALITKSFRKPPDEWDREARRVIELELLKADCDHDVLLERLGALGYDNTKVKHLVQRIQRGSFSFGFALRVLKVLGVKNLDISYVRMPTRKRGGGR